MKKRATHLTFSKIKKLNNLPKIKTAPFNRERYEIVKLGLRNIIKTDHDDDDDRKQGIL